MATVKSTRKPRIWIKPAANELLWSGHLYDYSGYAKANREVLFRLSKFLTIEATHDGITKEPRTVDQKTQDALDAFYKDRTSRSAVLLRFYVPLLEKGDRYKICYTMMETERVHPDFIHRLNNYYNEVWTPTDWNKQTLKSSGLTIPCYVMPLGVDQNVYKPGPTGQLPICEKISGTFTMKEVPEGFIFLTVFQPTFRKGIPVMLQAFEEAFAGDPTVKLVLAATAHGFDAGWRRMVQQLCPRSSVYVMLGSYSEEEMATIYRSVHAYVSTSMGEGWALPATECAATSTPCILPRHSAHLQYANDENAYLIDPDELGTVSGSGCTCFWYQGMPFSLMGKNAKTQLVGHLKHVRYNYKAALQKAEILSKRIRTQFTWDNTAQLALKRLREIWK